MKTLASISRSLSTASGLILFFVGSALGNPYQTPSAPAHSWNGGGGGGQGHGWNRTPQFTPGPGAIIAKPPTVRPPMTTTGNSGANGATMTPVNPNGNAGPEFVDVEQGAPELRSHQGFAVEGVLARDPGELLAKHTAIASSDTTASHSPTLPKAVEKDGKQARKSDK